MRKKLHILSEISSFQWYQIQINTFKNKIGVYFLVGHVQFKW